MSSKAKRKIEELQNLNDIEIRTMADLEKYDFRTLQAIIKETHGIFIAGKEEMVKFFENQYLERTASATELEMLKGLARRDAQHMIGRDVMRAIAEMSPITHCLQTTRNAQLCPTRISERCHEYCVDEMDKWIKTLLTMRPSFALFRVKGHSLLFRQPLKALSMRFFPKGFDRKQSVPEETWLYVIGNQTPSRWICGGNIVSGGDIELESQQPLTRKRAEQVIEGHRLLLSEQQVAAKLWNRGGFTKRPIFEYRVAFSLEVTDRTILNPRLPGAIPWNQNGWVQMESVCFENGLKLFPSEPWVQFDDASWLKEAQAVNKLEYGIAASMLLTLQ